jgi:hypothetical protein
MPSSASLALSLSAVEAEPIQAANPSVPSLESLMAAHAMTEMAASCGQGASCCLVCCCCC